jgi:DNA-binding CsgD family transcriptional regulator
MRKWLISASTAPADMRGHALAGMIGQLGRPDFDQSVLAGLHPVLPAASCAVYRTGHGGAPRLFMSASYRVPDNTRACWKAYMSGPQRNDRTLAHETAAGGPAMLCHITAAELPAAHRARVYEAHGVSERISIVQRQDDALFAVNFYRHQHQRPFSDAQLGAFEAIAPALLALTQKHIEMVGLEKPGSTAVLMHWHQRLQHLDAGLTDREKDVCARLLLGMTQDGIAADLDLGLPTVKTYRNRAFTRLGIHFRNELFAMMARPSDSGTDS